MRSDGVLTSVRISPFWCTCKAKKNAHTTTEGALFTDDKPTHTHMKPVTRPGFTPSHLLAPGRKRMSHRLLDGRSRTHLSYFLSSGTLPTVAGEWELGLRGVGAVAFKTMAALCVEVEPARWERGRPSSL